MSRMMRVVILMIMMSWMIRTRSHLKYERGDHEDDDEFRVV